MKRPRSGGGWQAIRYSLRLAKKIGWIKMWKAMRSRNACKTCAVGMGGQLGGMVNEGGHFPEVCKKSFQAMASDLQPAIPSDFWSRNSIQQLQAMSSRQLEHSGRIVEPVMLTEGATHYRPIAWEDAIRHTSRSLQSAGPERTFFYASGRSSNEAGFLLQLFARLFGTNYVNNCSYYCHQASGVGLGSSLGTGAGTIQLEDLKHTDLYVLIGANPASNHPRLMRSLMDIRRRGGKVIVVNPVREPGLESFRVPSDVRSLLFSTDIASTYLQPHIGGDIYWLLGVAKALIESQRIDRSFIDQHTEQFEEFHQQASSTDWDQIVSASGMSRQQIEDVADQFAAAENAVIGWCMGITHHLHGTGNVQMIANLALLRGMVGRRKAGVMPIRGHSNVQGLGSVGVTPALKLSMLQRLEEQYGVQVPTSPGYDTMQCMQAAAAGNMQAAFCLGGNLYGSNPDLKFAAESFRKIQDVTYLSTTLNQGHAHGLGQQTVIMPVLARDEEPEPTTQESMFSFVRLSDGGGPHLDGPKSEVSILAGIAEQVLPDDCPLPVSDLKSHSAIRELIADLVPGYSGMAELNQSGKEFHVAGRAVADYKFPTPSGLARFHAPDLPSRDPLQNDEFLLMTVRSEGQFNSVVYEEQDLYRGQERRDVVLMNSADLRRLNLTHDQTVRITSQTGELRLQRVREFDIREGNVLMYYPEANFLIPVDVDPLSKTPGFKGVRIRIQPEDC